MTDFSASTRRALSRKGIRIVGTTVIPDASSDMPFANGSRGYRVDDNGCGRIWSFAEVQAAAQ